MEARPGGGVSVVIPFYEAYDFFEEALASVRAQTNPVDEIIVVNDGCGREADAYLRSFDDITLITSATNGGVAAARNLGLRSAQYRWVAFLDADDRWKRAKVQKQLAYLEQTPTMDACHAGVETFDDNGVVDTYIDKPSVLAIEDLVEICHVTPPSLIIDRKKLLSIGGFDTSMRCAEDYEMSFRFLLAGYGIGFVPEALTEVRRMNHGNLSSSGRRHLIGHYQIYRKHWRTFRQHPGAGTRYTRNSFLSAGGKSWGAEQKLYFFVAKLLSLGTR